MCGLQVDYIVHGDDPCIVDGKDVYEAAQKMGELEYVHIDYMYICMYVWLCMHMCSVGVYVCIACIHIPLCVCRQVPDHPSHGGHLDHGHRGPHATYDNIAPPQR
jgi:hypothetical protein